MRAGEGARHADAARTAAIAFLGAVVLLSGCGSSEDGGPSGPGTIEVRLSASAVQLTRSVTASAVSLGRTDALEVTWYVDGAAGGTESSGTITQANPATYTAPPAVPPGGRVVIEARLGSSPSVSAADTLDVLFTVIHVDAQAGDDGTGAGTWAAPLRTVTAALDAAEAGDTVFVRGGTYDPTHGELPTYDVPEHVTLRGAHRDSCTLRGHGNEGVVVSLDVGAGIEDFTIENADRDLIAVNTSFPGRIRRISVRDPFVHSVLRVASGSEAVVEDCLLDNIARPLTGTGMELIWGSRATVRRCTLRGWFQGAFISGEADPLIEQSVFENNVIGVDTRQTNEDVTEPDLGGGPRGSQGGNTIRGNSSCGLAHRTPGTIYAINNVWNVPPPDPPLVCATVGDSCDICVTNTGTVFWCECTPP